MSKIPAAKKNNPKKKTADFLKYRGELATPIVEPPESLGLLREDNAERKAGLRQAAKLPELFKHFEIDPTEKNRWTRLAIALAITHVPGMHVSFDAKSKGGRPRKWKAGEDEELLRDAERIRQQNPKMRHTEVVQELLKTERWGGEYPPSLTTRYREARHAEAEKGRQAKKMLDPDVEAVLAAFAAFGLPDTTD
jgi:hypothetical protein